eukprot:3597280-Heterocapsa_arctica.AAC.1
MRSAVLFAPEGRTVPPRLPEQPAPGSQQIEAYDPILVSYQTMILLSSAPQGPAVLERLVTGAIRLYVSGREVNVFPYTKERAPKARASIENNSAQLLYEAAVAGGVAGRR